MKNHDNACNNLREKIKKAKEQKEQKDYPVDKNVEIGGPKGMEPTRYQDWESNGKVRDF